MCFKATACGRAEGQSDIANARPRSLQSGLTGLSDESDSLQNLHIELHIFT